MDYVEAPDPYVIHSQKTAVFLAGGIGNYPNWQAEATDMFNGTELLVLNPRRADFGPPPWTKENSEEQIAWEFHALRRADIILFWFPGGPSVQPIALFELGYWLDRLDKEIVVGRSEDYLRKDDIDIQAGLVRPKLPIWHTLAACADMVEHLAEQPWRTPSIEPWSI